jgi:thiol:disulfide interchange protein
MRKGCLSVWVLLVLTAAVGAEAKPLPKNPQLAERIEFTTEVVPYDPFPDAGPNGPLLKTVQRGGAFTLVIHGNLKKGFHTYPFTQRSSDPEQQNSFLNKIQYDDVPGLKPLWPLSESQPEFKAEQSVGVLLQFERPFRLVQDIVVLPDAKPGPIVLRVRLDLTVCDKTCITGKDTLDVPLTISDEPAAKLTPELDQRLKAADPGIAVVAVPPELAAQMSNASDAPKSAPSSPSGPPTLSNASLGGLVLLAMGGALLMLLTPCVFPMIPVTVSFFLKQSEKKQQSALPLALVYSGTIVVMLSLAVLLLGGVITQVANNSWLNLGFGLLLVYFALSLFGMYEIELPHFLTRFTSSREGQGGLIGAIFMALTFTITSFTCTGPFLGILLTPAASTTLGWGSLALLALVYSATFAAPFFLLALFPGLLKKLPKSGGWLNSVKVVMGFIELAFAFKFLSIVDANLHPGNPRWFTYDVVLCAWIVLSLACGLYLFGLFRLPHDTPVDHIGVPRLLFASFFIGLALYMTPALWRKTPAGVIGENLVAMLPQDFSEEQGGNRTAVAGRAKPGEGGVYWYRDYKAAYDKAVAENKLLFIDFTGTNCVNCRSNEGNVFKKPFAQEELAKYVCVQLYTDVVPDRSLSPADAAQEAKRNQKWEDATFGGIELPLYIVFRPDPATMEKDGKLQGRELARYAGLIQDPNDFLKTVLRAPLNGQVARAK